MKYLVAKRLSSFAVLNNILNGFYDLFEYINAWYMALFDFQIIVI